MMLSSIKKFFVALTLIILSLFMVRGEVFAMDFNSNLNNIKGQVTPEMEESFIKADREYLKETLGSDRINLEIKELEDQLDKVKNEYIETSNKIKVYSGNATLKNNAIRTAIVNRKNLLNAPKFQYDSTTRYIVERDYDKERRVRNTFTQVQLDRSLKAVVEILESLSIDLEFLKDTTFVISPYQIDGINGYTMTRPSGESTVIISNQNVFAPIAWIEKSIKSTTLHEIGHVFYNKNQLKLKQNNIKIENDTTVRAENLDDWKSSVSENFAEDFRIFASGRLGIKSFEPMKKKTNIQTNHDEFANMIESIV